ncbi:hypothetical protein L514_2834 [Bordetella bronchiseptica MBORD635]|nr:hypothetical protein L514_2834 [Bordetella bronchiseptica MBORD635]
MADQAAVIGQGLAPMPLKRRAIPPGSGELRRILEGGLSTNISSPDILNANVASPD